MKKFTFTSMLLGMAVTCATIANAQKITVTIAGDGTAAYNGDGSSGIVTQVSKPYDVCKDAAGNVYFSDLGNGRIRKLWAKNGMVTTIGGGGASTAEGVPAVSALMTPRNICLDVAGNIYFADSAVQKIRRIDAVTNIITTVAGTGSAGYSGDGGPATNATFSNIKGIGADAANNIYLVDLGNNRVRKVTAATGIVTTVAGTGTPGYTGDGSAATAATLYTPTALAVNAAGDVFFADQSYGYVSIIRKINHTTGVISSIAGSSLGGAAPLFNAPSLGCWLGFVTGLCLDDGGDCWFNEISCSCRRMEMARDSIYPVAGNFSIESYCDDKRADSAWMNNPYGICTAPGGHLYIADLVNNRIRKIIQLTSTPSFAYGEGQLLNLCSPGGYPINIQMAITDLDMAQTETWTVVTMPANGTLTGFPYSMASRGTDSLTIPNGMSYTPDAGFAGTDSFQVKVSDGTHNDVVTMYVISGAPAGVISSASAAPFICIGSTDAFTGSVPGGAWTITNNNASISFDGAVSGISAGMDTIVYTISNSCGIRATSQAVTISDCAPLGVNTVSQVEELSLFPNPASSVLNIRWTNYKSIGSIVITDITGRELLRNEVSGTNGIIQADISNLPSGLYMIKANGTDVRKFLKQ